MCYLRTDLYIKLRTELGRLWLCVLNTFSVVAQIVVFMFDSYLTNRLL